MDFLNDTDRDPSLMSPVSTRTPLSHEEVQRQRSKADNVIWFTHGEFMWRSWASVVWLMFLLPSVCILYIAIAPFSILHPVTWITDFISTVFSFWNVLVYVFIFGTVMMPVIAANLRICSVEVKHGETRMEALQTFLGVKHLCHLALCMLTGSVGSWWLSSLTYADFGTFAQNCSSPCDDLSSRCLNEMSLFLLVFAAVLSALYSVLFFKEKHHQLRFPVVQQERIFRVKACLVPSFWQAVVICLKSLQICYPLYFLFGVFIKDIVRVTTGLEKDRQLPRLDSVYGLLDIRLFWFCFATGVMVSYIWILASKLFIIFQTEVLRFPIQATFAEQVDQSLPVVLKCETVRLLKYLAFNDLCQLSKFSAKRRKQIFSLSVPGGRPLNWLWVSDECLTLLSDLKTRLLLSSHNNNLVSLRKSTDSAWKASSRTPRDVNENPYYPRQTSSSSFPRHQTQDSNGRRRNHSTHDTAKGDHVAELDHVKENRKMLLENVKEIPLARYFLEKRQESEMEDLFYDAQLQIWATEAATPSRNDQYYRPFSTPDLYVLILKDDIQSSLVEKKGLSRLVATSFTEDVFGVVQKTLPFILSSLLELEQAVDIYLKRLSGPQTLIGVRHPSRTRKTVHVLRDTLRCSIYRITEAFHHHLSDIELSANNKELLKSFLKFQE